MLSKPATRLEPEKVILAARIPAIPAALQAILDAAGRTSTTSAQLEQMILKEAGLCSQIFRMVNSSYYALVQKITSVNQAVVLLGHTTVRSIASSLIMLETVGSLEGLDQAYLSRVWKRSVVCGGLVRVLCAQESKALQQKMFLGAMVHDIGHLVLSFHFKANYGALTRVSEFPTVQQEIRDLGVDHAEIGAALLKKWGFDSEVTTLVRHHHRNDDTGVPAELLREVRILFLCDALADLPKMTAKTMKSFAELEKHPDLLGDLKKQCQDLGWPWEKILGVEKHVFEGDQGSEQAE